MRAYLDTSNSETHEVEFSLHRLTKDQVNILRGCMEDHTRILTKRIIELDKMVQDMQSTIALYDDHTIHGAIQECKSARDEIRQLAEVLFLEKPSQL